MALAAVCTQTLQALDRLQSKLLVDGKITHEELLLVIDLVGNFL